MNKIIPLSTPTMCGKEIEYINDAFKTNWIAPLGPNVNAFEDDMCNILGVKYAFATSSGTGALHLAVLEAGIKKGDIVFVSDMTFIASVNPIIYAGAIPIFIDANYDNWQMDINSLRAAFNKYPKAKAVIVSHLYGQSADMDPIIELCKKHNAILIEDAAESLGSTYKGKMSGTFGDFGCYSFNGNKIITTSGGGLVISKDEKKINHMKFLGTQAKENELWYEHKEIGYNYRMSNICAGIGRGQLSVLSDRVKSKQNIYKRYYNAFKNYPYFEMMPMANYGSSNCWLSAGLIKKGIKKSPLDLLLFLKENNIESRPIWKPMHMQPVFKDNDFISAYDFPVDEDIFNRGICLPSDVKMSEEEQNFVISKIKEFFL